MLMKLYHIIGYIFINCKFPPGTIMHAKFLWKLERNLQLNMLSANSFGVFCLEKFTWYEMPTANQNNDINIVIGLKSQMENVHC